MQMEKETNDWLVVTYNEAYKFHKWKKEIVDSDDKCKKMKKA